MTNRFRVTIEETNGSVTTRTDDNLADAVGDAIGAHGRVSLEWLTMQLIEHFDENHNLAGSAASHGQPESTAYADWVVQGCDVLEMWQKRAKRRQSERLDRARQATT